MTKNITLIVTWDEQETVGIAYIIPGIADSVVQLWGKSKQQARHIITLLQEDNPDYGLYISPASQAGVWDWIWSD